MLKSQMDFGVNIRDVAKLLSELEPGQDDSDSDTETSKPIVAGPGDIVPKTSSKPVHGKRDTDAASKTESGDIWESKEAPNCDGSKDAEDTDNNFLKHDPRQTPNYEMHYLQSVTTEDVFLHLGNKTPGTASCENLVVKIHLPADELQNIQLNLKKQAIDLRSPIHFLYLNLPHQIDPRAGNAKWDKKAETLIITLKLVRELDDINF